MWKLTITQKRKTDYGTVPDSIELMCDNLNELTLVILRVSELKSEKPIEFKIEKVEEKNHESL